MVLIKNTNSKTENSLLNLLLAVLFILIFSGEFQCYANEISFTINPNCTLELELECEKPWLIYGKQENETYTVHYLWSGVELPSFLMAYSAPGADLEVNWTEIKNGMPGAINFTIVPENIFGISFQTLILFNDVDDTGTIDNIPEKYKKYAPLSDFDWSIDLTKNVSISEPTFSFFASSFRGNPMPNDTIFSISVTAYTTEGRSDDLPHLLITSDSSHVEIILDNLILDMDGGFSNNSDDHHEKDEVVPISGFNHPRWAIDSIVISDDKPSEEDERPFFYENKKSLDDEYTPGVFDLDSITTEGARVSSNPAKGGYLQWRPVCYLTSDRDINYSTYPNINTSLPSIDDEHRQNAKSSLFFILFGNDMINLAGFQTPIAFGLSNDDYYTEYNYTEWTFAMGLGAAPKEGFSTLMIIIISVAVGIPCLLFIGGGTFLIVRKGRRRGTILINEE